MNPDRRPLWLRTALLIGILYPVISFVVPGPIAFVLCGIVFTWHLWHERFRLNSPPRSAAWHTAVAVCLGGFALALAANIHDLGAPAGFRPKMLVALVAWPLITAVPAFVVALIAASVHEKWRGVKPTA